MASPLAGRKFTIRRESKKSWKRRMDKKYGRDRGNRTKLKPTVIVGGKRVTAAQHKVDTARRITAQRQAVAVKNQPRTMAQPQMRRQQVAPQTIQQRVRAREQQRVQAAQTRQQRLKQLLAERKAKQEGRQVITKKEINPKTGRPYGIVAPVEKPQGAIDRSRRWVTTQKDKSLTATQLGKSDSIKEGVKSVGIGALSSVISTAEFARAIASNPVQTVKQTGRGAYEIVRKITTGEPFEGAGSSLKKNPGYALGFIGGEVGQAVAIGKGISLLRRGGGLVATRVSPKYKPVVGVDDTKSINKIPVKGGKNVDIKIAKPLKTLKEPLRTQAELAGKKVTGVSGQANLPSQIYKGKTAVDRWFFADPRGRLRISRMGLKGQKEASLLDIMSGDVTIKSSKPKGFIFYDTPVEKFPKNLADVGKTLKAGKTLSQTQASRLTKWQNIPTGKWKPIGFLSTEPEIILPAGQKFTSKLAARTIIKGKPVALYSAELLTKGQIGTLGKTGTGIAGKIFGKSPKTISSIAPITTPYLSVPQTTASVFPFLANLPTYPTSKPSRPLKTTPKTYAVIPTRHLDPYAPIPPSPTQPTKPIRRTRGGGSVPIISPPSPEPPSPPLPSSPTSPTRPLTPRYPRLPTTGYNYKPPTKPSYTPKYKFKPTQSKAKFNLFPVYGKRFGKFKLVGVGKTKRQAVYLGRKWATQTLGASFKVPSVGAYKLPNFYTKGDIFIEKRGKRLKKRGMSREVEEILGFKKVKSKRRKKK